MVQENKNKLIDISPIWRKELIEDTAIIFLCVIFFGATIENVIIGCVVAALFNRVLVYMNKRVAENEFLVKSIGLDVLLADTLKKFLGFTIWMLLAVLVTGIFLFKNPNYPGDLVYKAAGYLSTLWN